MSGITPIIFLVIVFYQIYQSSNEKGHITHRAIILTVLYFPLGLASVFLVNMWLIACIEPSWVGFIMALAIQWVLFPFSYDFLLSKIASK